MTTPCLEVNVREKTLKIDKGIIRLDDSFFYAGSLIFPGDDKYSGLELKYRMIFKEHEEGEKVYSFIADKVLRDKIKVQSSEDERFSTVSLYGRFNVVIKVTE